MKITFRHLRLIIREACWDGYRPGAQTGKKTKKKGDKRVPNRVTGHVEQQSSLTAIFLGGGK